MTPPHPAKPKADAVEVLRELEWLPDYSDDAGLWRGSCKCPVCDTYSAEAEGHHSDDCRLAAALAASASDEITALRATNRDLHRRMQKAEGKTRRYSTRRYMIFAETMWKRQRKHEARAEAAEDEITALRAERDALKAMLHEVLNFINRLPVPTYGATTQGMRVYDMLHGRSFRCAALSHDRTEVSDGGE